MPYLKNNFFFLFQKDFKAIYRHISPRQSVNQITHFFQSANSGKFRRFDYGDNNIEIYNETSPPDYKLDNISVPMFIYHGGNDFIVGRKVCGNKTNCDNKQKLYNSNIAHF